MIRLLKHSAKAGAAAVEERAFELERELKTHPGRGVQSEDARHLQRHELAGSGILFTVKSVGQFQAGVTYWVGSVAS